jgi:hypothetical protein
MCVGACGSERRKDVGREAVGMRPGQKRTVEGWCPCGRRARDVEIYLEMNATPGNLQNNLH